MKKMIVKKLAGDTPPSRYSYEGGRGHTVLVHEPIVLEIKKRIFKQFIAHYRRLYIRKTIYNFSSLTHSTKGGFLNKMRSFDPVYKIILVLFSTKDV
jgi:hypothetical protein